MIVDWNTRVITVFKSDLTQLEPQVYKLDVIWFKETLGDLLDDTDGISYPDIFEHYSSITIGGTTLAPAVEIINGYTVTFEDDQYIVELYGANNNISDVTNINCVSVRSANSAGLVKNDTANNFLLGQKFSCSFQTNRLSWAVVSNINKWNVETQVIGLATKEHPQTWGVISDEISTNVSSKEMQWHLTVEESNGCVRG